MFKYFTLEELIQSDTAKVRDIANIPTFDNVDNLKDLVKYVLEPLRELYNNPITVTSGYRSEALNKAVNGVKNSHHVLGCAADIVVGSIEKNKQLFNLLINSNLQWTQAILEEGGKWIHVSYIKDNLKKQVLYT